MRIRRTTVVLAVVAVGVIGIVCWGLLTNWGHRVWYSGPMTFQAAEQAHAIPGVAPVTFSLLTKPYIETERGNHFSGPSGKYIYRYDGRLAFDGTQADLHSTFHPVALFRVNSDYFLLGRYWFNQEKFQWQKLSAGVFQVVAVEKVPAALLNVHLVDQKTASFHQLWTVRQLLSSNGPDTAAKCFARYVAANPHFAYEYNKPYTGHTTLPDLLIKVRDTHATGFFDPLVEVLNHSTDGDVGQDVGLTALTLVELRKAEGSQIVQSFIDKVKAEVGPNAPRLHDLEWRIKLLQEAPTE